MQRQWPLPLRYCIHHYQAKPHASMFQTNRCWRARPILWKRWWLERRLTELQDDSQKLCKTSHWLMTSPPPTGAATFSSFD